MAENRQLRAISLTSHTHRGVKYPIQWGQSDPLQRGPIIGSIADSSLKNTIGSHAGSYCVYRAMAVAKGDLSPVHKPDLTNTEPVVDIGPYPQWFDPAKIVSIDPWGHRVASDFKAEIDAGVDIRPTIAITKARITIPEIQYAVLQGLVKADGKILLASGEANVTKIALEPVWHLPGIAERIGVEEMTLRRAMFEQTGGMFPELVTRPDISIFMPPIGSTTIYLFGDIDAITDPDREVACRVHDECNGSDVFGSDICTCRPYLTHGIEVCIGTAQKGGVGIIVYNRKEGRALGEVTKFLVYNARKRQTGGDRAAAYFERTECIAGVEDMRFQPLMPDPLHWLGVTRIDHMASMSNMKFDALTSQGIEIVNRVTIPDDLIPEDARVEMDAKKAAGYFCDGEVLNSEQLAEKSGRDLEAY
ncbi:GTP cyclohydrolase II [Oleiphilus messinensis]|uniref:GTP cyclohydrolase II n=1 Tax=Oleiphilus messinensis TaxID=141451 RepID=A0A1Y0I433_9GAMM|nr:GTP cyclohydrolase II [Oleiphilus messinensis]ARU54546.1 GTP cyclohydrolase II [Oleiphilus messinensis]